MNTTPTIKYYTNVSYSKNKLHIRGFDDNGNSVCFDADYQPTVWVPLNFNLSNWKREISSLEHHKWKCLIDDEPLVGVKLKNIAAARYFVQKNISVVPSVNGTINRTTNVHTAPNNMFVSQYIAENFPGDCHISANKLKIYTYDIETEIGHRNVDDDSEITCRTKANDDETSVTKQSIQQKTMTIAEFETMPDNDKFELLDASTGMWVDYKDHPYRYIGGFPDPNKAEEKITLITVKDINSNKIDTWGLEEFVNNRPDVVTYHRFSNEKDLLQDFVDFIAADYPHAMTGWNCLAKDSSIWKNDCIVPLSDIKVGDQLFTSSVVRKSDVTNKRGYELKLTYNGNIVCSKDHIFPCYVFKPDQRIDFSIGNVHDLTVEQIKRAKDQGNVVFVCVSKHENNNEDATYRDLIKCCPQRYIELDWTLFDDNQNKIDTAERLVDYVTTHDSITVKFNIQRTINFDLNQPISEDFCHLLGLIYTDGTYYKITGGKLARQEYAFYNNQIDIINKVDQVRSTWKTKSKDKTTFKHTADRKGCYQVRFANSNVFGLLKPLIYDQTKKSFDLCGLSRLSRKQFLAFLAGLIDGDGCVVNRYGSNNDNKYFNINWCNFDGDCANLKQLLLWNGILASHNTPTNVQLFARHNSMFQRDLELWHPEKLNRLLNSDTRDVVPHCITEAHQVEIREDDQHYFIRVLDIADTNQLIEMLDIETDTHYFYCNGVKTHNCSAFDNTYVANRVKNVLGVEQMNRLSPYGEIEFKQVEANEFGNTVTETTWKGISNLDYLKLYKKFTYGQKDSYKLDAIAEFEIGIKKVENPTGGSFKDFYTGSFDVRTKPEESDNQIRKLGYIRTQLHDSLKTHPENRSKYQLIDAKIKKMCKQLFIEYNIRDVELVDKIDAKQKFLDLIMTIAYYAHCNYEDVFSPVRTWDYIIFNHLNQSNTVIPIKKNASKSEKFPGAYVKSPLVGKHEFCESFDLDSLGG